MKESWKEWSPFPQKYQAAQLVYNFIIINIYWAGKKHIRMISEGSCDTEDAKNCIIYILKLIKIKNYYFKL